MDMSTSEADLLKYPRTGIMTDGEHPDDVFDRLFQADDADFHVLRAPSGIDVSKKLYVLVHPGDVPQKQDDIGGTEEEVYERVMEYSQACQEIMGAELERLGDDWDVVILHRGSTAYQLCNDVDVDYTYNDAIDARNADPATCLLWGDDLQAAGEYIRDVLRTAERPQVVLAGAWSMLEGGCVTGVGQVIDDGTAVVKTSQGTCISPDGSEDEWIPSGGKVTYEEMAPAAAPTP